MQKRAAIYARVSSDEQRERETIKNQIIAARAYCSQNGYAIVDEYLDDGVTGMIPLDERPAGKRLLLDASRKAFDLVVFKAVDRLGRETIVTVTAMNQLRQHARLHSLSENIEDTPAGRLWATFSAANAAYGRELILENSKQGMERGAKEGRWLGGIVPYGYKVENRKLVPNEEALPQCNLSEAEVVRLIFQLSGEKRLSTVKIADKLNGLAVPTAYTKAGRELRRGKRKVRTASIWRPGRVRNMLVETTYKGLHRYGKRRRKAGPIHEREVPALVSERLWQKAQESLASHYLFSSRERKRNYLLRGLIKCEECTLSYIGAANSGKRLANGKRATVTCYKCNGRSQHRAIHAGKRERCGSPSFDARWLEEAVWQDIEEFIREPGIVLGALEDRLSEKGARSRSEDLQSHLASLRKNERALAGEREKLLVLYRKGRITEEELERQTELMGKERSQLEREISTTEQALFQTRGSELSLDNAERLLKQLSERLSSKLTFEDKREIVLALVQGITVGTEVRRSKRVAVPKVRYYFGDRNAIYSVNDPALQLAHTGRDSWPRPA
jgi:site-specific DNA recombinase